MDKLIGEKEKGQIVSIDEHDESKWVFGIGLCEICRRVWLSQAHVDSNKTALECPSCKRFRSYFIPQDVFKRLFDVERTER